MLLNALQENLIVLLTYDQERASIIRGIVAPEMWSGPYRQLVVRLYDHLDRFKKPAGDHLPDILADKIEKPGSESQLYVDIIESIHSAKEGINPEYVMSQLETFIRRQSLRTVAVTLAKALQRDTEESLDEAETLIASAGKSTLSVFDPGTRLSDKKRALKFLDINETAFPIGIPELDRRGFGPTRKELWLFIGNTGAGKSWMLIQLAKMALLSRAKVVHLTLEMSEERAAQRYMQTLFAISKRDETYQTTRFQRDTLGRISGFDSNRVKPRLSLADPKIRKKLHEKIDKWGPRLLDNIIIKQFPSGALTVNQIKAYLDNLEQTQQFVPDLLIVDYPDLMKIPANENYRLGLDEIFKELRGMAITRNMALAAVSQSHRAAAKAKQVGADNVSEAYSKIQHSDTVITYTQTKGERQLGLARLYVAKGRNDSDRLTIVISQQYGFGGFVLDSILMTGNYWGNLPKDEESGE